MGRPLTGTSQIVPGGHLRAVPSSKGSTQRTSYIFRDAQIADLWLDAAIKSRTAGQPLPLPAPIQIVGSAVPRVTAPTGTSFRAMAERWCHERYRELQRGGVAREIGVTGHINALATWIEAEGLVMETMVRDRVKQMNQSFSRADVAKPPTVPEGLDLEQLVTIDQAAALPDTPSKATLKRRKADGTLPTHLVDGRMMYRTGDLYTSAVGGGAEGGLTRGPRRTVGMHQDTLADRYWVFGEVCLYAQDFGVAVPTDRESLKLHRSDHPGTPVAQHVDLQVCAQIAGRLHAVHQLALWLMRILGLRISEAYGLRVQDIAVQGPGEPGILTIRRQGGRKHQTRDLVTGEPISADSVEGLKNAASFRVLVAPPALMTLITTAIRIFHTDPDGTVHPDARLIPGLARKNAGGQEAFRTALSRAARAAGLAVNDGEVDEIFHVIPHHMRHSVITDLTWKEVEKSHLLRFAGHQLGDDVHSRVYVLDDPLLRPAKGIAEKSQRMIEEQVPDGLARPTTVRCTTGNQPALMGAARRLDAELTEVGWLVLPEEDGQVFLGAAEVAHELDVTPMTARRWMKDGTLPAVHVRYCAQGEERRAFISDVVALRDKLRSQVTLTGLAEELGQTYHTVSQYVKAQKLVLEPLGERGFLVPVDVAQRLRKHYQQQAELKARAVPLGMTAERLDLSAAEMRRLLASGDLVEDSRAHDGRRMITRESVERLEEQQDRGPRRVTPLPTAEIKLMTWLEAQSMTGLTKGQMQTQVAAGVLVLQIRDRGQHITQHSVLKYLVEHHPERLAMRVQAS